MKRNVAIIGVLALLLALSWLATTENSLVWPVRNTLQYHALTWLTGPLTEPTATAGGRLTGVVVDAQGQPVEGAWVLVAHRSGVTYTDYTSASGAFSIDGIPSGSYRPVATAPAFDNVQFGNSFEQVTIRAGQTVSATAVLPAIALRPVAPGQALSLSPPTDTRCTNPLEREATRREVTFNNATGQPNQPTFYYTPVTTTATSDLPLLLAIYPGPADSWECASVPLAAAGYAVLAAGPAYTFDLEADLDELERLLMFARDGQFPGSSGRQLALLGGSYSSLHVQRLLQRGQPNVAAALLLGPPTDLFDMRRRLENGTFLPPFGLDKALIALGLPDRVPLRYFAYSGAYHARADFPPLAILHSRSDDVVPFQQSELLANNLEQVGAPYEAHFFDGASHYLLAEGGDADTLKIYDITLDFLNRQLQQSSKNQ